MLVDRTHRGWAVFFVLALSAATGWYLYVGSGPGSSQSGGSPMGLTFGFAGILLKLIKDYRPDYLVVVIDVSGDRESFRRYDRDVRYAKPSISEKKRCRTF